MYESSKAAYQAARAGLKELKVTRKKAVERAPFPGLVLQWLAEPGESVGPGRPLLLFGDDALEVRVQVTERDVARGIAPQTPVLVELEGGDALATYVKRLSPLAKGPGRLVEVRIWTRPPAWSAMSKNYWQRSPK